MTTMKTLIATNDTVLAKGLEAVLVAGGVEVCAVCRDVTELMSAFFRFHPEVAILDHMILPVLDVIGELRRLGSRCQIVLWDHALSPYEKREAMKLGVRAILSARVPPASVLETVNLVAAFPERESSSAQRIARELIPIERQVFALVGYGMSDEEIAAAIRSDAAVVGKVVKGLARSFGAQNRCELALYGLSALSEAPQLSIGETDPWKNEIAIV